MLRTHWRVISRLERIGDSCIVIAAFFLAYYLRESLFHYAQVFSFPISHELPVLAPLSEYLIVLGVGLPLYNAVLSLLGGYKSMRFAPYLQLLRLSIFSSALVFLCEGAFLFVLKLDLSRSFVGTFCLLSGVGLLLERLVVLLLLRFFRVRGKNFRNVLIVGTGGQARKLYLAMLQSPELGAKVAGFVSLAQSVERPGQFRNYAGRSEHVADRTAYFVENGNVVSVYEEISAPASSSSVYDLPARVVATAASFEGALKRCAIDEVLFTDVMQNFSTMHTLAKIAIEEGVRVTFAADIFSLEFFTSDISYFGDTPLIHYHPTPGGTDSFALIVKRTIDILVSSVLLLLLSPLLVLAGLAIKLDSRGPVFFRQRRVGLNGRTFILLKFRSMVDGAETMLAELRAQNEMTGPVFKLKNDPRLTRVGKFLRRYSMDELPQLTNVLRGHMSLVGPRPPLPEEVSLYRREHRKRLSMRPGLTCTWQVSGRNDIPDFDEWARLDLEYIDHWSLGNDFKLLLQTIPAVLSGSGAR